jgi:putative FmdB family regulatory protein
MPVYDYACPGCGHRFEAIHGVHDEGPKECPACGSNSIRKAFAPPVFHFKGSGWAKMDRRSTARTTTAAEAPAEVAEKKGDAPAAPPATGEASASASGPATPATAATD